MVIVRNFGKRPKIRVCPAKTGRMVSVAIFTKTKEKYIIPFLRNAIRDALDQGFSTYGPWPSSGPQWFF